MKIFTSILDNGVTSILHTYTIWACPVFILFFPCLQETKHSQSQKGDKPKANFDEKIQPTPAAGKLSEIMDKTIPQQKNFSARNQRRFLKNQLKNQSAIENSTQNTSNSSDIDCLAKTNQSKAIETGIILLIDQVVAVIFVK